MRRFSETSERCHLILLIIFASVLRSDVYTSDLYCDIVTNILLNILITFGFNSYFRSLTTRLTYAAYLLSINYFDKTRTKVTHNITPAKSVWFELYRIMNVMLYSHLYCFCTIIKADTIERKVLLSF